MNAETIEKRIRLLGLKKSHVADRINISPSELSMYLKNKRKMPEDVRTRIKSYLGL